MDAFIVVKGVPRAQAAPVARGVEPARVALLCPREVRRCHEGLGESLILCEGSLILNAQQVPCDEPPSGAWLVPIGHRQHESR